MESSGRRFLCNRNTLRESEEKCVRSYFVTLAASQSGKLITIFCDLRMTGFKSISVTLPAGIYCFFKLGFTPCNAEQPLTTRHGVTRKRKTKRLRHAVNLFKKNLQLKDVC